MDRTRPLHSAPSPPVLPQIRRVAIGVLLSGIMLAGLTGCSLFVMAGKMVYGDPKITSQFKQITKTDLIKEDKTVLILCSASAAADQGGALQSDVIRGLTQRLKSNRIKVVDSNKVYTWLNDHGGRWETSPNDIARDVETDFIIHVQLDTFTLYEENSSNLYRGRAAGSVNAYQVVERDGRKHAEHVFVSDLTSSYPLHNPVPRDQSSERSFRSRVVRDLCEQLGRLFYDYRAGDGFN